MRILIVKLSSLGDLFQVVHAVRYLQKRLPQATVDWLIEKRFVEVAQRIEGVNRIIAVDIKTWKKRPFIIRTLQEIFQAYRDVRKHSYDYVFDFQGNIKSGCFTFLSRSQRKIGFHRDSLQEGGNALALHHQIQIDRLRPIADHYVQVVRGYFQDHDVRQEGPICFTTTEEERRTIDESIAMVGMRPILMICHGSAWENKNLRIDQWEALLHALYEEFIPFFVFIYGNEKEYAIAKTLHRKRVQSSLVLGSLSLSMWQYLMTLSKGVVSVDSSALHLAGMAHIPTFGIFGPSSAKVYGPVGKQHMIWQGFCPYGEVFTKRCKHLRTCKTGSCLKESSMGALYQELRQWYQGLESFSIRV